MFVRAIDRRFGKSVQVKDVKNPDDRYPSALVSVMLEDVELNVFREFCAKEKWNVLYDKRFRE